MELVDLKSNLETEIEEIFKDRIEGRSDNTAGIIYGVLNFVFYQVKTGNYSINCPVIDAVQKKYIQSEAGEFIKGFVWCMEAAGLINSEKREQMIDELHDLRFPPKSLGRNEAAGQLEKGDYCNGSGRG